MVFLILIFVCVFVFILSKTLSEWIGNCKAPVLEREAVITELFTRDDTTMTPIGTDGAMMPVSNTLYKAKFRFADGSAEEFSVPRKIWKQMQVGMCGTLTSKGTRFQGFS